MILNIYIYIYILIYFLLIDMQLLKGLSGDEALSFKFGLSLQKHSQSLYVRINHLINLVTNINLIKKKICKFVAKIKKFISIKI
jgi:hypothetical protein